jgi:hypothetical protein
MPIEAAVFHTPHSLEIVTNKSNFERIIYISGGQAHCLCYLEMVLAYKGLSINVCLKKNARIKVQTIMRIRQQCRIYFTETE